MNGDRLLQHVALNPSMHEVGAFKDFFETCVGVNHLFLSALDIHRRERLTLLSRHCLRLDHEFRLATVHTGLARLYHLLLG